MLIKSVEAVPNKIGAVAQLGEHLLCKQGVSGSIPLSSTIRLRLMLEIVCAHGLFAIFDRCPPRGRRTIGDGLQAFAGAPIEGLSSAPFEHCLLKKNKFARSALLLCLFCKNREEKIDLEASRYGIYPMFEAGPYDVVDGLAGRTRKRDQGRKEACHSGRSLFDPLGSSDDLLMSDC